MLMNSTPSCKYAYTHTHLFCSGGEQLMLRVKHTRSTPTVNRAMVIKQQSGFVFEASANKHCSTLTAGL